MGACLVHALLRVQSADTVQYGVVGHWSQLGLIADAWSVKRRPEKLSSICFQSTFGVASSACI